MSETTNPEINPKTGRTIDPGPVSDPVNFSEYLRRKNELLQSINPLSPQVYLRSLSSAMREGYIKVFLQGGNEFVDWEKYKDYVFKTSYRVDRRKKIVESTKNH